MEIKTNQAEIKSKKGLGMTLNEAIGELEKGYRICNQDEPKDVYYWLLLSREVIVIEGKCERMLLNHFKTKAENDKSVWYIYQPEPLKHKTQQARVEKIENQRLRLFENAETIKDLTERNGNLTRITNDQKERIEFLEHENKNYESAIKVIETNYKESDKVKSHRISYLGDRCDQLNESRERLASKFTNWFIFLVFTNIVSIAWGVYQLLTNGSK